MTEKFTKLLCGVLSAAMLFGSAASVGFADADKDEEAAAQEEAAEVTAQATPQPQVYNWENDSYYTKALTLCSSLGIIEGKDDGQVHPEAVVTRAEMATIVLRLLAQQATETYGGIFSDVDASHWAAQTIQTAYNSSIIDGFDDGTFVPDGDVTATQVAKMLVCGANYNAAATYNGGWPQGYLYVADNTMKLFNGCSIADNNAGAQRGNVIKMAYNALLAPYNQPVSSSGSDITYSDAYTWAKVKFDVIDAKGMLLATHNTTVTTGQSPVEGKVVIDCDNTAETYDCALEDIDYLVGKNIIFYYKDTFADGKNVIAMMENVSKTETADLNINDIKTIEGFEESKGTITMSGTSKTYKCTDAQIIYNGKILTVSDYNRYKSSDANRFGTDINDFLLPECGTIKLVDNDQDKNYDIVYVDSYETFVVSSATAKKVIGTCGYYDSNKVGHTYSVTLDVENNSGDKTIKVLKKDMEVKPKNLSKDDVVSLKRSVDDMVITMEVSGSSLTGTIQATGTNTSTGVMTVRIAGEDYDVAAVAYDDCSSGIEGTFWFDSFDRIGLVSSSSSGLSGSEKYGWIMKAYEDGAADGVQLQLFTQDGTATTYSLASTVRYWAPGESAVSSLTTNSEVGADIMKRINNGSFETDSKASFQIRLVKFSANSKNEITQLYCATETTDTNAMLISTTNFRDTAASGSLLGGYYVVDGVVKLVVPGITAAGDASEFSKASNYSASTVTATDYLKNTEGVSRDFILGQFDKNSKANVLVEFVTPASSTAYITDYGTANNNPCFIVDRIGRAIDADGEDVYTVTGYSGGAEVTYTTTQNTLVARVNSAGPVKDKNTYNTDSSWGWSAIGGAVNAAYGTSFQDYVKKGDIYGVQTSGGGATVLIKMADAKELYKMYVEEDEAAYQWIGSAAFSDTRDDVAVLPVTNAELTALGGLLVAASDSASRSVSFSSDRYLDVVEYNITTGEISYNEDDYTISDVGIFKSETKTGDIAFIRHFKGNLQDVMLIRFTD
ncbi:MAG: S-layer homology domain-containing protein [Clostridiales bacterium]|nr:S-layer homology domain-containing protein [Clostridiales bacterium]